VSVNGYLGRLSGSVRRNHENFRLFGRGALTRFFSPSVREYRWPMKGVGPVTVRVDGTDVSTLHQVFVAREYDLTGTNAAADRVAAAYARILASGQRPIIIDAGANIGAASLWFHQRFGEAAIVAIEPEQDNARILRANLASVPRATVIEAAIAGAAGKVDVRDGATGWDVTTTRSETGSIPAITMGDALASVPDGTPFIAKIDIEGFESDLFSGDCSWINDMAMVIIEPHDWMHPGKATSAGFQREMGKRGFEVFIQGENLIYIAS
jgi:FkbM family methyltransferase